jgi:hypothetical protein
MGMQWIMGYRTVLIRYLGVSENGAPRKLTSRGQILIVGPVDLGGKFGRPDYIMCSSSFNYCR